MLPPFAPRLPAALGLAGTGAAFLALALLGDDASYGAMLVPLVLAGISLGIATPALVTRAVAAVPSDRAGMAAAVNNTARQAGGAVGVALIGGVAGARGFALGAAALLVGAAVASVPCTTTGSSASSPTRRRASTQARPPTRARRSTR